MNRDSHLIFEAYRKKQMSLINEMDIGAEFGSTLGAVASGVAEREKSADTYIFKLLKSKNPDKSHDEIVKMVVEPLYNAIFVDNKFSAKGSHKDQLAKLQTALENELAKSYPKAQSGYTARIIKNFLAPVVKILDAESPEVEGGKEAVKAVKQAVDKVAAKNEVQAPEPTDNAEADKGDESQTGEGADREIERLRGQAVDFVGNDTVKEQDVLDHVKQAIINADSEISEGRAKGKAVGVINSLVAAGVLAKKNGQISAGDKADEYAEKGDLSLVSAEPEDYLAATGRHGGRTTTGRQVWGGEGGRYGVDFG